eukprot:TRINITY_DN21885_c0_g6_i1.p1 TRINITY_DN21885_c0_g6~~TRINITY_DN21885_c0_g6_i1.p1  ORF type:complete len:336 (+),score=40.07 TRINITY_DN21885_c0_g6_i1:74-1081(+)
MSDVDEEVEDRTHGAPQLLPPEPREVPLPRFPRHSRAPPAERVALLYRQDSGHLQELGSLQKVLREVGCVLFTGGKVRQARSATDLGRTLSPASRTWLLRQHLGLLHVLRCFPQYFRVSPAGGVTFLQAQLPNNFAFAEEALPAAGAERGPDARPAQPPTGPSQEVTEAPPEPLRTSESERHDDEANGEAFEVRELHPEVPVRPAPLGATRQKNDRAAPERLVEQEQPKQVDSLDPEQGREERRRPTVRQSQRGEEKEVAAVLAQRSNVRADDTTLTAAEVDRPEEASTITLATAAAVDDARPPRHGGGGGPPSRGEQESGRLDDVDEEVVFVSL